VLERTVTLQRLHHDGRRALRNRAAKARQLTCVVVVGACLLSFMLVPVRSQADDTDSERGHTEIGLFPLVGGSTDLGIGGGAFSSLARYEPGYRLYRYRIEAAGAIMFKSNDGQITNPYQEIYVGLTVPELIRHRLRLEVRASYTNESTLAYYGLGNAAKAPNFSLHDRQYYQYGSTHPTLLWRVRLRLTQALYLELGQLFTYERLKIYSNSLISQHIADPELSTYFGPTKPYFVNVFEYTFYYDTRDQETAPRDGQFHSVRLRLSPGGRMPFPYRYGSLNVTLRAYRSRGIWTLATRLVVDSLFGNPPFYEIPRYEDTYALGGANGVRGVPAQRYYGRQKIFGNLEARVKLFDFTLFGMPCQLGAVAFFDAGRLWSDFPDNRRLDGTGLGLKWGTGGGIRLQQGRAFVVRADFAWSPDALPIGAYVTSGHAF
jgi:outer membrane protein assembly factor BamA